MRKLVILAVTLVLKFSLSYSQINANFISNFNKGCAPLAVQFTNTSTGNPDSCYWELGITNNTSINCNPGAIYPTAGIYNVKLTVFKGTQRSSITKQIIVFKNPVANFSAIPRNGCVPAKIQFNDLSIIGDTTITSWFWDTGDGKSEITQNPIHTYTFSGNFGISLIVRDANGCTNTITKNNYETIFDTSTLAISLSNVASCTLPASVNFNAISNAPNGSIYSWNFGDGDSANTKNTTHNYTAYGNYTVTASVTNPNNCKTTVIKDSIIKIQPFQIDFSLPVAGCLNKSVAFSSQYNLPATSIKWDFGNGITSTKPDTSIIYRDTGFYTIKLIGNYNSNCTDTVIKTIHITQTTANFTVDNQKSCTPFTANFTNLSNNADSSKWLVIYKNAAGRFDTIVSFQNNPSIFLPFGSLYQNGAGGVYYDVILITTSAGGCKDTMIKRKYIYIVQDDIKFLANIYEGCEQLTVTFNYQVLSRNFPYSQIIIHYDDGTQAVLDTNSTTNTHVYSAGTYRPYIEVKFADSLCNRIIGLPFPIKVGPRVNFFGSINDNEVCVGECIVGTATGGLPNTVFTWTPSGSGTNANICFNVAPTEPGTMPVILRANTNGCKQDTIIDYVKVLYPLAVTDNVPRYCNSDSSASIYFVNRSIGADSSVWDFGDGTILSSNADTVRHTYTDNLPKTIILTVYNFRTGCSNFKKITLSGFYNAKFNLAANTKQCAPFTLRATAVAAPFATSYRFQIYNIDTSKRFNIDTFRSTIDTVIRIPGIYHIKLTVKYGDNCISIIDSVITVAGIKANFVIDRLNSCTNVQLVDSSLIAFSPIQSVVWKYTNGIPISTLPSPITNLRFDTSNIRYTITNTLGCKDSIEKKIITKKPVARFNVDRTIACPNINFNFTNTSTTYSQNVSYTWIFGDGDTSNEFSPSHIYTQTGTYTVKLILVDSLNCADTLTRVNLIKIINTNTDFTAIPRYKSCPDLVTNFTLIPPTPQTQYTSIIWDFGNGNTSNDTNRTPRVAYTYADSFDIRLITKDTFGCIDTIIKKDYIVVGGPSATYSFTPTDGCIPLSVQFNATFNKAAKAIWDFGNGVLLADDSLQNQLTNVYTTEGTYTPALILQDSFGCSVTYKATQAINPSRISTRIIPDKLYNCNGNASLFVDSSYITYNANITNIQWKVDTNTYNNYTPDSTFLFIPKEIKNSYMIYLSAFSSAGCVAKDSLKIDAYNTPFNKDIDKLICVGDSVQLNATGATNYLWTPTNTLSNATTSNPIAKPTTTTQYIVVAYDTIICPIRDTINVVVKTNLLGGALKDDTICAGDSVQLRAFSEKYSLQNPVFTWSPNNAISNINDSIPIVFPTTTTTYNVNIKNGNTCNEQNYPIQITVLPKPTVNALSDQTVPPGTTVLISANSPNNVTYHWTPSTNLSCDSCAQTDAIVQNSIIYTVTATDENQCKANATVKLQVISDCDLKYIYIPNSFSPNGDGINDIFKVRSTILQSMHLEIYNRWGNKVFESDDINKGWDGTYKGKIDQVEVYAYYFIGECIQGEKVTLKGNITFIK